MLTTWGYEIDVDSTPPSIPPLLTAEAFNNMTGGKYANAYAVSSALLAASQAVRNECGWHISPSLSCTYQPIPKRGLLRLPSNCVTAITSVKESDVLLDSSAYEWLRMGLVRRVDGKHWSEKWNAIEVVYTAGFAANAVPDVIEAVRAIAEGVLTVAAGVVSESADGVSISYSANASSIAAALTQQQKAALAPYKVVDSHAA